MIDTDRRKSSTSDLPSGGNSAHQINSQSHLVAEQITRPSVETVRPKTLPIKPNTEPPPDDPSSNKPHSFCTPSISHQHIMCTPNSSSSTCPSPGSSGSSSVEKPTSGPGSAPSKARRKNDKVRQSGDIIEHFMDFVFREKNIVVRKFKL